MKRSTLYLILGAVAVLAVGGALIWRSQQAQESRQEIRSAVVERGTMVVAVSASGSVEPATRVSLSFEGTGRVAEVAVEIGDAVSQGDLLARLDSRLLALQAEQSQAALELAEAQLAQTRVGPRSEEIARAEADLEAAQARLSAAAANRDQVQAGPTEAEIAAAETQVASAELQHRITLHEHDRIINTSEDEEEREQARYDLWAAEQAVEAAHTQLEELQAGADEEQVQAAQANVWTAAAQRDAAQAQLDLLLNGATEEQIEDLEAQVEQARAALELAELSLERTALRAPFDGLVSEVNVTAGELTPVGLPAITLLDASQYHVTVSVDEIDVGRLIKGQTARVTLDAFPEAVITGSVERIAPIATLEGGVINYDVTIGLAPPDVPIRADMTANATIEVEELADVLMLPTWVVRVDRNTGQTYVHRRTGDETERVEVKLGVRYEGTVQVLEGLSEGEEVVWIEEENAFGFGDE